MPGVSVPHPSTTPADWDRLRKEFSDLARAEAQHVRGAERNDYIYAHVIHSNESGERGDWYVSEGLEDVQVSFVRLATQAGVALGSPQGTKPLDFWLHHLFLDLRAHKSKHLRRFIGGEGDSGFIERVCRASAIFCERLETRAFEREHARPPRRSVGSPNLPGVNVPYLGIGPNQSAERAGSTKRLGRTPKLPSDFVDCAGKMWSEMRRSGRANVSPKQLEQIASELDAKGYTPPAEYLEKKSADELRSYNSRHSNSRAGRPIKTWAALIATADKDHVRGMRRLLSRCAEKIGASERLTSVRK